VHALAGAAQHARWPRCLALLGAAWGLTHSGTSFGHDPLRAFSITPADPDATVLGISTNRGLIFADRAGVLTDGARARLLCHAGLSAHPSERLPLLRAQGGGWIVGTSAGILRLADDACSITSTNVDVAVQALVESAPAPGTIYAVTADAAVGSALWRSRDGGQSFESLAELGTREFFNAVSVAPSDPMHVYTSGARVGDDNLPQHFVARWREESGLERIPLELAPYEALVRVLAVNPSDPSWVVARTEARGFIGAPDRLLSSRDGGDTWSTWGQALGIAQLAFSEDGADAWLVSDAGLLHAHDGGEFTPQNLEHPPSCVLPHGSQLLVCDALGIHTSTAELTPFASLLDFSEVAEPVRCGTAEALPACSSDWQDFERERLALMAASSPVFSGTDAGSGAAQEREPSQSGCSFALGTRADGYPLMLALALLLRTRGRRALRWVLPLGGLLAWQLGADIARGVLPTEGSPAPDHLALATCEDDVVDGDEADTDCGGKCGSTCVEGQHCKREADCAEGLFCADGGRCTEPSCDDGLLNGNEIRVDCGGGRCRGCASGTACRAGVDCQSRVCSRDGTCTGLVEDDRSE
jgi:hypothetical protein